MLTKARLWLARLLLPRGWVVERDPLFAVTATEVAMALANAERVRLGRRWLIRHGPQYEPRADTLGQDDIAKGAP